MTNGHIVVARSRETKGVYVEATDDLEEYADMRLIYCQAVSEIEKVQEKICQWRDENDDLGSQDGDINIVIAEMVSSMQWIANEHPISTFRRTDDTS